MFRLPWTMMCLMESQIFSLEIANFAHILFHEFFLLLLFAPHQQDIQQIMHLQYVHHCNSKYHKQYDYLLDMH